MATPPPHPPPPPIRSDGNVHTSDSSKLAVAARPQPERSGSNSTDTTHSLPPPPPIVVPPYWQHRRHASYVSTASSCGPRGITLEDHTAEAEDGDDPPWSPLWARLVEITDYVRVEGDVRGAGGYVVWTVRVETLDGGCLVIRKRYSEFETLRRQLAATFPRSGSALPSLPSKSVFNRFRPSFLEKRRVGLAYFLNCVLLNPEFSGSPVLKYFIFS